MATDRNPWHSLVTLTLNRALILGLVFGLGLAGWSCAGPDSVSSDEADAETEVEPDHVLVGRWTTSGNDARYGEAVVHLRMAADGGLIVTVELAAGGTLRFSGSWMVAAEVLLLNGTYFEPDGQASAVWSVEADSVMMLRNSEGDQQRWRRSG